MIVSEKSSFTKVMTSIASATLPGVEKLIKTPILWDLILQRGLNKN